MQRYLVLALTVVSLGATPALANGDRAQRFFGHLDTNKDGVISQAEVKQRQAERFAKIDADGDGTITLEEFSARSSEMFTKADADGNGEITQEEFAAAKDQWRQKHEDAQ